MPYAPPHSFSMNPVDELQRLPGTTQGVAMESLTVDLSDVSTTLHADSDVNAGKALLSQQQQRLQELKGEDTN